MRLTRSTAVRTSPSGTRLRMRNGAKTSKAPGKVPSAVAVARCSSVAPSVSARVRASPAPAPTPRPTAAVRPARPKGPNARNGPVEPTASPNFRPGVSPYPGAGAKGALAAPATRAMVSRVGFSYSSGRRAEAPMAACSTSPTAPGMTPLKASPTWPKKVVSGAPNPIRL